MTISNVSSGLRPGVCTSTTRPTSPYVGQLIFETDTAQLKYWDGSKWNSAISAPTGSVQSFAGTTAPTGWLLCFGQAISRTDYADLFSIVGTTYGVGNGSTTFNVPDLRGRTIAGVDNMGGSAAGRLSGTTITGGADAVGEVGGAQTHALSGAEISHRHNFIISIMDNNYMATGQMGGLLNAGAYRYSSGTWGSAYPDGSAGNLVNTGGTGGVSVTTGRYASQGDTDTNSYMNSSAHNNVQPTMVLNYIIKV